MRNGAMRGVTLERNKSDYYTGSDAKIVVDGVERPQGIS